MFPVFPVFESIAEVRCLALNIYFEARGETNEGQLAVGHVVINRAANSQFPNTLCDVVVDKEAKNPVIVCQFSWWCDGKNDRPKNSKAWRAAIKLANRIYNGLTNDPTEGALWYHATYVRPYLEGSFCCWTSDWSAYFLPLCLILIFVVK